MRLFKRKPKLTFIANRLTKISCDLRIIEGNNSVPAPIDIEALAYIRYQLKELEGYCKILEPKLWKRVEVWRDTPYSPNYLLVSKIVEFISYWFIGTLSLYGSFLWIFQMLVKPWDVILISAVLSSVIAFCII